VALLGWVFVFNAGVLAAGAAATLWAPAALVGVAVMLRAAVGVVQRSHEAAGELEATRRVDLATWEDSPAADSPAAARRAHELETWGVAGWPVPDVHDGPTWWERRSMMRDLRRWMRESGETP